jgi:hypothetical protein
MTNFKSKVVTFLASLVVLASLGIAAFSSFDKTAPNEPKTGVSQIQNSSSEKSKPLCLSDISPCQGRTLDSKTKESDLNVVSNNSSSGLENQADYLPSAQTTIKGILSNLEIADKGKNFIISSKENSMLKLEFSTTAALDLAKKYDKSFVTASGKFKETIFLVDNLSPAKFDGQVNQANTQAFTGQTKFATILCKFSDDPVEDQTPSWFQNRMEGSGIESTKTYWNEVSDGTVNISGGQVFGWFTLPRPRSYYVGVNGGDIFRMFQDCTAVADSSIYFPNFEGINLFFNDTIDDFAAGIGTLGRWGFYLDNNYVNMGVTWMGTDGWSNSNVIQHELGHTAGLPHSSSLQGEYGSDWDLMSFGYGYESGVSGALPAGIIAYYRALAGLIPDEQIETVDIISNTTYKLGQVNQYIPAPDTKRMLIIPVSPTNFYTLESRKRVGYDKYIPEAGVLIHNVDLNRQNLAFVEDIQNDGNVNNLGSVLRLNESYTNTNNDFIVEVVGDYATGYQVKVSSTKPVVNITSPSSRLLVGANYSLTADASVNDGTITKVEFYKSGVLISTDTSAPYQTDLTNLSSGDFILTARAYDNSGNIVNSNGVVITVASSNNYTTTINAVNIEYTHTTGELRFYGTFTDNTSCGKALNITAFKDGLEPVIELQRAPNFNQNMCAQTILKYDFDKTIPFDLNYNELVNFNSAFRFSETYFII